MKSSLLVVAGVVGVLAVPAPERRAVKSSHYTSLPHKGGRLSSKRQNGDSPWAGGVKEGQGWTMVTGAAKVPSVTGQDPNAGAAVWVGIDGYSCQNAILQTGFTVWGDGRIETWYEWWPENSYNYETDLGVQAGDKLRMTVYTNGQYGGNSTIENLTNGRTATNTFTGEPESICQTDAEWIVEDFLNGNNLVQFADFGSVKIEDAYAIGPNGKVTPEGSHITEVTVNGQPHTSCSADASGVSCKYI